MKISPFNYFSFCVSNHLERNKVYNECSFWFLINDYVSINNLVHKLLKSKVLIILKSNSSQLLNSMSNHA